MSASVASQFHEWALQNVSSTCKQYLALVYKNLLLCLRNWKMTACTLLLPALLILTLYAIIVGVAINLSLPKFQSVPNPPVFKFSKISPCIGFGGRSCKTIAYAPSGNDLVSRIMKRVLQVNQLSENDIFSFASNDELQEHLLKNPNTTGIAVSFNMQSGMHISYTIIHNTTTSSDFTSTTTPADLHPDYTMALQMSIDNAIISLSNSPTLTQRAAHYVHQEIEQWIDVKLKEYPLRYDNVTIDSIDFISKQIEMIAFLMFGGYFIQMAFVATWVVTLYYLAFEKEHGLRFGLTMMGVENYIYWASWFTIGVILMVATSVIIIVTGLIVGMPLFTKTDFFVLLFIFISYGVSQVAFSFVIASIISSVKTAIIISFVINGLAFFFGSFTSSAIFVYVLYYLARNLIMFILQLFPPFSFVKCLGDISIKVYYFQGHYTWKEFFMSIKSFERTIAMLFAGKTIPSGFTSVVHMLVATVLYLLVAWYLDNVIPTTNGAVRKPWFFLQPSFWGLSYRNSEKMKQLLDSYKEKLDQIKLQEENTIDPQIIQEIEQAVASTQELHTDESRLLRIIQLEKTYSSLFKGNVEALKGVSLTAETGTCLAILGHNGAGKTTLISSLIGLTSPTNGTALVFGLDIDYDINLIRSMIGVCPQQDILWEQLTAWETMRIFAMIKNVPLSQQTQVIKDLLQEVNLLEVKNQKAGEFSGGMKRRLSVAMAMIGTPKLVFLDEPTTGLDAKSRRNIWSMIYRMKKDKLVVLTTHSMEEADRLADKIAIIAFGKLKCIGNGLRLKTQFGAGYNLNLVCTRSEDKERVQAMLLELVPNATIISDNAGSLMYSLPKLAEEKLVELLQMLEQNTRTEENDSFLLRDWAIQQTSLEEVFLRVTKASNFGYSAAMNAN